jgi:hypothetical protein
MNLREVGRGSLWFAIGAAIVAVAVVLLHQQIGPRREPVTIRSYPVTPEIAGEMKSALVEALSPSSKDGTALGRVSLAADGRLLVAAPESVQTSVASILAEVAAKKPAPTPSIHFEIWLVSATAGTVAKPDSGTSLVEVGPALADIQKARGPLHFELVEKLALRARAGDEDSRVEGALSSMRVNPTVRQDSKGDPVIAAKINVLIDRHNGSTLGSLKALVELRPGQLLVIGQSSLPGKAFVDSPPEAQVYYIVRASL